MNVQLLLDAKKLLSVLRQFILIKRTKKKTNRLVCKKNGESRRFLKMFSTINKGVKERVRVGYVKDTLPIFVYETREATHHMYTESTLVNESVFVLFDSILNVDKPFCEPNRVLKEVL